MTLAILPGSEQPIYQQIYDCVSAAVLRGELAAGEALPPIRTVASELCVSVIGVKRAWEELERDGFITTAVGRGSFAAELSAEERSEKRRALLRKRLAPGAAYAAALGAEAEELAALMRELLDGSCSG